MSNSTLSPVKISITNVYGGGDYTAQILVGSNQDPANVILDTGSSTLAVKTTAYKAASDTDLQPTSLAQDVTYGTGGWAGPVVHTSVVFNHAKGSISISDGPVAITEDAQQGNFGEADGIMGLAYSVLNQAYDVKGVLQSQKVDPPVTYPWPFDVADTQQGIEDFLSQLEHNGPSQPVSPYFAQLEQQGIVMNKFALYTLRSFPYQPAGANLKEDLINEPLNQGFLILGGGEEQTDLYEGEFSAVQVVHDEYYNVNIISAQLEGAEAITAQPLQPQFVQDAGSNGIIDSGTNSLALDAQLYQGLIQSFNKLNPEFGRQIERSGEGNGGIAMYDLNLAAWPTLHFNLQGEDGNPVTLSCSPDTYWQTNVEPGRALFNINGLPGGGESPNQSILGLPLMNNYFTIFDRSVGEQGIIKFATIKPPVNN